MADSQIRAGKFLIPLAQFLSGSRIAGNRDWFQLQELSCSTSALQVPPPGKTPRHLNPIIVYFLFILSYLILLK